MNQNFSAALFDLDGVIFHTEPQYDLFWERIAATYRPDAPQMVAAIKGTTLVSTFEAWFSGPYEPLRTDIQQRLDAFEASMNFNYVPGFQDFLADVLASGIRTAVVTSSNLPKMGNVYRTHPEFRGRFDAILTSEDFSESKPHPDCFLKAAARLGVRPGECIVFEDSLNGLRAAGAAGMRAIALCTTLPPERLAPLSAFQFSDFRSMRWKDIAR